MKEIIRKHTIEKYSSKAFDMYFKGCNIAVFDIETTGLIPARDKIILTGILEINGDNSRCTQYFAERPEDEAEVIRNTLAVLSRADCIVTYNGRSFDMPFLEKRAAKHNISTNLHYYSLDLYMILSRYSELRKSLDSLSQKNVEFFYGISDTRDDEINGYQSVQLYERYVNHPSYELEEKITLHNHDDVMQLYKLLPILSMTDIHRAMFCLGYPAGDFIVNKCTIVSDGLHISARKGIVNNDYICFPTESTPYNMYINASDHHAEITIPSESIRPGISVIDAQAILNDLSDLERYPAYESGYLLLKTHDKINYMEINAFVMRFLKLLEL